MKQDNMKLKNKYIKVLTKEKSDKLISLGFPFIHERNGVYFHKNNEKVVEQAVKLFSDTEILNDIKFCKWINI